MAYSRSLLRWSSAPDPGVFRFALQGRPTGISHSLRLLDENFPGHMVTVNCDNM